MTDMHIKMPDVTPIVRYTANGVDSVYEYPFPIFASEDISVLFDGARQNMGFAVTNAGETSGGTVVFDTPPSAGIVVTIYRDIPFERMTDFLESGEFSAKALNNELDYLMASVQQVARAQSSMIRYADGENVTPSAITLPDRGLRANKALGFDGDGNPVPVAYGGGVMPVDYTATGTGAVTRHVVDKVSDIVSVKDFGAVGDGVHDDTIALKQAFAAHYQIYIPSGTYRITDTVSIGFGQKIIGAGQSSVIKADSDLFTALQLRNGYAHLSDFVIEGGNVGLMLFGLDGPCVQNRMDNLIIRESDTGILLDGGADPAKPCYWNIFNNCLVLSPSMHGIHFTKTGAGDTPNANIFDACRVYSNGEIMTGHGIYVEYGAFYNRLMNCEVNVDGLSAQSCVTIGGNATQTVIDNLYTESTNGVPNMVLANGSTHTYIQNLLAMSDGSAIDDQSGGNYQAVNAGYPTGNKLNKTHISDATVTLLGRDTVFVEDVGVAAHDLSVDCSVHLVSAYNGAITINVPLAATAQGKTFLIKKIDQTGNPVIVSEPHGLGIDRKAEIILGGPFDYVEMISNGAEWFVTSSNRMAGNTKFYETAGLIDIDMSVDTYLISSYAGAVTCRLPPANAAKAIGRTITIKKTDPSTNHVTITEQGAVGPDHYAQTLTAQYKAMSVVSNGAAWHVVSTY